MEPLQTANLDPVDLKLSIKAQNMLEALQQYVSETQEVILGIERNILRIKTSTRELYTNLHDSIFMAKEHLDAAMKQINTNQEISTHMNFPISNADETISDDQSDIINQPATLLTIDIAGIKNKLTSIIQVIHFLKILITPETIGAHENIGERIKKTNDQIRFAMFHLENLKTLANRFSRKRPYPEG